VHFAAAARAGKLVHHEARYGDIGRSLVREKSVLQALAMLQAMAE
jgi:nicotinamide-nucleotide amidase